jgi:hypothetical protein
MAAFVASKSADLPQETVEVQVELHRRLENLTAPILTNLARRT